MDNRIKLYIDFDGVILDTIDVSYEILKSSNIDTTNYDQVQEFYHKLDWEELISISKPINNNINNLKKLINSNLYDITILTHINSNNEINAKKKFIKENIGDIQTIYVEKKYNKCDIVDAHNAILVDDYMGNLEKWEEKGGIPIKFSTTGKKYECISIDSLELLIDKYEEIKRKIPTRIKKLLV